MKSAFKTLLKDKPKTKAPKNWGLIGFFDSPDVNSLLVLAGLGLKEGKSELIRRIVSLWLKDNNAIELAANQIKVQLAQEGVLPASIKGQLEKLLRKKGVSKKDIDKVLKLLL
jgi:hypothetical protein